MAGSHCAPAAGHCPPDAMPALFAGAVQEEAHKEYHGGDSIDMQAQKVELCTSVIKTTKIITCHARVKDTSTFQSVPNGSSV